VEFSPWLGQFPEPWFFSDAEGAARRMRSAGFHEVKTDLEQASFAVSSREEFQGYLRTFVLHRHLELLPSEALRERFVKELAVASDEDNPPWTLDYWRLNLRGCKAKL
jgi:hypothetical protein